MSALRTHDRPRRRVHRTMRPRLRVAWVAAALLLAVAGAVAENPTEMGPELGPEIGPEMPPAFGPEVAKTPGEQAAPERIYAVTFDARIVPTERAAHVTVRLRDPEGWVKQIEWRIDPERHRDFGGTGTIETEGDVVRWLPTGGSSRFDYVFRIDHLRDEKSYDARCAESWAIFRGDDLVPPAAVRSDVGARSTSRLRLKVPEGWSKVAPFPIGDDGAFQVVDDHRRFDRPVGWMAVGELAVLRETVAGTKIAIAGPYGNRLHRLDILALLRWTLPSLRDEVGSLPDRLVIVGAGDPMWRGALSGPRSAFVHASRPLISDDTTSPVLHEIVHATLGIRGAEGADWIVEGLAEYYSMEALVRSQTISRRRHAKALARMARRAEEATSLTVDASSGAVTARAVGVFAALDAEIQAKTEGQKSLDDVVRILVASRSDVTNESLEAATAEVAGSDFSSFFRREVDRSP